MDLIACYRHAWSGFSRWWLPLCAVAFLFVALEFTSQWLASSELERSGILAEAEKLLKAESPRAREHHLQRIMELSPQVMATALKSILTLAPLGLAIGVLLLVWGMKASSPEGIDLARDTRRAGRRGLSVIATQTIATVLAASPFLACNLAFRVYTALVPPESIGELILISLVFFIPMVLSIFPCAVIYIFFFFAPQLCADEELGPLRSMRRSITLVRRAPFSVFLLAFTNFFIQVLSSLTIIGLIPATAFANTARGVAYYQLLESERAAAK